MKLISLQSGSNGNCIYLESGGVRLLFDAGISGKQAETRLAASDIDIRDIDGLIISHDHVDHIGCAGIHHRKFNLPVYVTRRTMEHASHRRNLGRIGELRHFVAGDTLSFGGIAVETIPTPHDGVDGVAFVVSSGGKRLGILTDLGHVTDTLDRVLETLDGVLIEANYDTKMLDTGMYPPLVKQRIKGPGGHLSNLETARLLKAHSPHLKWACLGHLSEQNNTPELALATCRDIVGDALPIHMAGRYGASPPLTL